MKNLALPILLLVAAAFVPAPHAEPLAPTPISYTLAMPSCPENPSFDCVDQTPCRDHNAEQALAYCYGYLCEFERDFCYFVGPADGSNCLCWPWTPVN